MVRFLIALLLLACASRGRAQVVQADEKRLRAFAEHLAKDVREGRTEAWTSSLDLERALNRALGDLKFDPDTRLKARNKADLAIGGLLTWKRLDRTDGARFLKFKEGRPILRFYANSGFDYLELRVEDIGGVLKITDFFSCSAGETMAENLQRVYLESSSPTSGVADDVGGWQKDFVDWRFKIDTWIKSVRNGAGASALKTWETFPESIKERPFFQSLHVEAAGKVGPEAFESAWKEFRKLHPDNPAPFLILRATTDAEATKADLARIDALDEYIGGDPFLLVLKGNLLEAAGQLRDAEALAKKCIAADPTVAAPHWLLVGIYTDLEDFSAVLREWDTLESELGVKLRNPEDVPAMAELVKSPEYAEWKKKRESK